MPLLFVHNAAIDSIEFTGGEFIEFDRNEEQLKYLRL